MNLSINVIKSIKNAVLANNIEVSEFNTVMWDVCKKDYKFFIGKNPDMYYTMPDGTQCLNINPIFNLKDMMAKSDVECMNEWFAYYESHQEELNNMIHYFKNC